MKIIGFAGKKGVGKNFVADLVAEVLREAGLVVEQDALANPIKDFCEKVLGLDPKILHGNDEAKNAPTQYRWENMPKWLRKKTGHLTGFMSHRKVMQVFGTELCREIWDPRVWSKALGRRTERCDADFLLITDARFSDEVESIQARGGQVWNVVGPRAVARKASRSPWERLARWLGFSRGGDRHISENALGSNVPYAVVISNELEDSRETPRPSLRARLTLQCMRYFTALKVSGCAVTWSASRTSRRS